MFANINDLKKLIENCKVVGESDNNFGADENKMLLITYNKCYVLETVSQKVEEAEDMSKRTTNPIFDDDNDGAVTPDNSVQSLKSPEPKIQEFKVIEGGNGLGLFTTVTEVDKDKDGKIHFMRLQSEEGGVIEVFVSDLFNVDVGDKVRVSLEVE